MTSLCQTTLVSQLVEIQPFQMTNSVLVPYMYASKNTNTLLPAVSTAGYLCPTPLGVN